MARCRDFRSLRTYSEGFLFVLSKRNPSDSKEKTALAVLVGGGCLLRVSACREWSSRCRMALLIADRALLRLRSRHWREHKLGGKGAKPPITPRQAQCPQPREPRPWAGSARSAHLARPRLPARAAYQVPFCPAKWDTLENPVRSAAPNAASIGMAARIGRPKSPAGFACRGYLILRL